MDFPDSVQGQVADDTVLQAVVAELELMERCGLDRAYHFGTRKSQNGLIERWQFTIHNCELKAKSEYKPHTRS